MAPGAAEVDLALGLWSLLAVPEAVCALAGGLWGAGIAWLARGARRTLIRRDLDRLGGISSLARRSGMVKADPVPPGLRRKVRHAPALVAGGFFLLALGALVFLPGAGRMAPVLLLVPDALLWGGFAFLATLLLGFVHPFGAFVPVIAQALVFVCLVPGMQDDAWLWSVIPDGLGTMVPSAECLMVQVRPDPASGGWKLLPGEEGRLLAGRDGDGVLELRVVVERTAFLWRTVLPPFRIRMELPGDLPLPAGTGLAAPLAGMPVSVTEIFRVIPVELDPVAVTGPVSVVYLGTRTEIRDLRASPALPKE